MESGEKGAPPDLAHFAILLRGRPEVSKPFPQDTCEHICGQPLLNYFINIWNFISLNIFVSTDLPTFLHPSVL